MTNSRVRKACGKQSRALVFRTKKNNSLLKRYLVLTYRWNLLWYKNWFCNLIYAHTPSETSCDCCVFFQWLQMYSLGKLKLDLTKLVSGPDCRHVSKPVKALGKRAEAKYVQTVHSCQVGQILVSLQSYSRNAISTSCFVVVVGIVRSSRRSTSTARWSTCSCCRTNCSSTRSRSSRYSSGT